MASQQLARLHYNSCWFTTNFLLIVALFAAMPCMPAAGGYPAGDSPTVSSFPQLSSVLAAMHTHAGEQQQQQQQLGHTHAR
jgi:hypothetical protein